MSLAQAVRAIVVLVAVLFGAPANALAHAGHEHASLSPVATSLLSDAWQPVGSTGGRQLVVSSIVDASRTPNFAPLAIDTSLAVSAVSKSPSDQTRCPPGACCCQGASSCGMGGHCCASTASSSEKWFGDLSNHVRYHLARLGWAYPEMIFGLDRPPKA